jgi:hypothetical protein
LRPEPEAYLWVAQRSLAAANALLPAAVQEAAGFYAYHAFESLGGALCTHHNVNPPKTPHSAKIARFQAVANPYPFGQQVATLAITVQSLRNDLLYPSAPDVGGMSESPDERYTAVDAQDLINDVAALIALIGPLI